MKTAHLKYLPLILLIVLFSNGCVSSTTSSSKPFTVSDDNIFHSSKMPELNLSIDKQIRFIGSTSNYKAQKASNNSGMVLPENSDAHVFAETGSDGKIKRCLVIMTSHLTKTRSYYNPGLLGKAKYYDYLDKIDLNKKRYHQAIFRAKTNNVFEDYINTFIIENGLEFPQHSASNIYGKRFGSKNNYRLLIYYIEDATLINDFNDKDKVIEHMINSPNKHMTFLN